MKKLLFILFLLPIAVFSQTLELPFGVRVLNPEPLDAYYYNTLGTAYTSTSQVTTQVVSAVRYIGQTFNVNGVEYWFESGITNGDLIAKTDYWKSSGSTTITTPTIVGDPFLQGNVLIGPSGATITANTRLDVRGISGGTNIFRLALQDNTTVLTVAAGTGISTFSNSVSIIGTNNGFSSNGAITNPSSAVFLSAGNPTHTTGTSHGFQMQAVSNYSGASTTFISFANNLGFTAGVNHTGFDHNPANTNLISGTHLSFRATSGQMFLANSSSDVVTASTRADLRGISSGNILRLSNSLNTRRFNFSDAGVLTIDATPTNNNAATEILARNSSTGVVEYRDASSIGSSSLTSTYVGYGSGSNALTGEAAFNYTAASNQLQINQGSINVLGSNNSTSLLVEDDAGNNIIHAQEIAGLTYVDMFGSGVGNFSFSTSAAITSAGPVSISGSELVLNTISNDDTETRLVTVENLTGKLEYRTVASITSSPAGSDTQVQINNAGAFGADADLTFTGGNTLNATNATVSTNLTISSIVSGRVPFTTTAGLVTSEAALTYNDTNNTLTVGSSGSANIVIDDGGIDIQSTGGGQLTRYRYYGIEGDGTSSIGISNTGATNNVALSGNSGSSIILEIQSATSGDIQLTTGGAASGSYIILSGIPTSSIGLPSGAVYSNAGVLTIVP